MEEANEPDGTAARVRAYAVPLLRRSRRITQPPYADVYFDAPHGRLVRPAATARSELREAVVLDRGTTSRTGARGERQRTRVHG